MKGEGLSEQHNDTLRSWWKNEKTTTNEYEEKTAAVRKRLESRMDKKRRWKSTGSAESVGVEAARANPAPPQACCGYEDHVGICMPP